MIIGCVGGPERVDSRLTGRISEREWAIGSLRTGGGVVLAGPHGVGKTSLARSVAEDFAREMAVEVTWVSPTLTEPPIPFGALAPLAPELASKSGRQADLLNLLQNFRATLVRRGRGRPLLLAVDDAHRLDVPSACLLRQLVTDRMARVVIAVDSDLPAPACIHSLWKEGLVERIEVGPLDEDAIAELISDLLRQEGKPAGTVTVRPHPARRPLPPSVGGDVSDAIWRLSQGIPLYARELLREGRRTGHIALKDGVWRLEADLEIGPRLADLMAERMGPLTSAERDGLELVALGEPFPFTAVLRLVRSGDLEALERRGLVSFALSGGEHYVRVSHPVIAAVVRRSLPMARAAGMRLRLANALSADGRAEEELVRVVSWRLDAGSHPGGELLVRASRQAAARQDWRVAARLAEAAMSRRAGCEGVLALADAYRALGRFREALEVLGDEYGEGDDQTARAGVLRSSVLFFGFGRLSDALDVLAAAVDRIDDPSDQAWLRATKAGFIGLAGRPAKAVELAEKVLAEPGLRPRADMTARAVLSIGLSCTGRTERAIEVLEDISPGPDAPADLPTWCLTARTLGHQLNGQIDAAERAAREGYATGLEHHDPRLIGPAAAALGWAELERGRLPRAVGWFREAAVALRAAGTLALRAPALVGLAEALALSGDLEGAKAALEETRPAAEHGTLLIRIWSTAAAWLAAAQGAVSEALERLDETAAEARAGGHVVSEIRALHSAVRIGSGAPATRLAELASWVEGRLIPIMAAHAAALEGTDRIGESLDAVAERYAELGLNLYAAEAAAQASRAHAAIGRTRKAAASATRGHFLLGSSRDGGPPLLGLALALTPPELTRREHEVAMLAAGGLPSQAIATRLCLSVRTVETHLARVYAKLGIGGRSELPNALASAVNRPEHVEAG